MSFGEDEECWQLFIVDQVSCYFSLDKTDEDQEELEGATFSLYSGNGYDSDPLGFICTHDEETDTDIYTFSADTAAEGYTTVITAGNVTITGIPVGTYYLRETGTPAGHVRITGLLTLTIDAESEGDGPKKATVTFTDDKGGLVSTSDDGNTLTVENSFGTSTSIAVT